MALDLTPLLTSFFSVIRASARFDRIIVFGRTDQENILEYRASSGLSADLDLQETLRDLRISFLDIEHDPLLCVWLNGESLLLTAKNIVELSLAQTLAKTIQAAEFLTIPLQLEEKLVGLIVADNTQTGTSISDTAWQFIGTIASDIAQALESARSTNRTIQDYAEGMHELYILRQIDRELNDTIELNHVFDMTQDWALRFTNAQVASLALYDEATDELRIMVDYGWDIPRDQIIAAHGYDRGIAQRVARSGRAEVIPDVSVDKDYVRVSSIARSHLSVPVMREERVIAVISVESKKLNGFTDKHLDFVEKLATRAGVAIDNARLFADVVLEREKLSHILGNIADVVIVVGPDDRVILINHSAMSAMQLPVDTSYIGQKFVKVFAETPLLAFYDRVQSAGTGLIDELVLGDNRAFHTSITHFEGIGWIIFMHDVTPFKEMDRLKSELIATVSHDLKQPLTIMNGYLELLMLKSKFDAPNMNYIEMIRRSIRNMRQLIDDLLDLAKIESGIQLELEPLLIQTVLLDAIDTVQPMAASKSMTIMVDVPDTMPNVLGDYARLRQVFINLIGNAVKYTQEGGRVKVSVESRGSNLRIAIQDNGMGISPEDQARIFDRFYRVRRPENESIEGTGLGLAIVKSLIEAHKGQIGLESRLGEGSTFYLTLPVHVESPVRIEDDF